MKTPAIIEGLTILQKYRDKPDGFHTGAEHDVLYSYATDKPLSQEDLTRMVELDWWQEVSCGDRDDEFSVEHYDASEGWSCFT